MLRTQRNIVLLAAAILLSATGPIATFASSPQDAHHVMWTNSKGVEKCFNKKTKTKADNCADKIRAKKGVTNVVVMPGSCRNM